MHTASATTANQSRRRRVPQLPFAVGATCAALCMAFTFAGNGTPAEPGAAQLLVFVQRDTAGTERRFERDDLPAIRALAAERGLSVRVHDARHGAPPEVTATPALVLDSGGAHVFYVGPPAEHDRVRDFLSLAPRAARSTASRVLRNLLVSRRGRATTSVTLYIAPLAGSVPADHKPVDFDRDARCALLEAFREWKAEPTVAFAPTDRVYHVELHPWRGPNGEFRLSVELFAPHLSQTPIFTTAAQPIAGVFDDRNRAFGDAARALEMALRQANERAEADDTLRPLPADAPRVTWEACGALAQTTDAPTDAAIAPLPLAWRVSPPDPAALPIRFHFMPPLQPYAGEVRKLAGQMRLGPHGALAGATARFAAEMRSLSMHDPELDDALAGETFLSAKRFPEAVFTLERFEADAECMDFAQPVCGRMLGQLELKGVRVPLSARFALQPTLSTDHQPRLELRAAFALNIAPFGLQGPVGPPPSGETMMFEVTALLEPSE